MNISINQKDNIMTATLSEGQNTLNFNIDVEQEKLEQKQCIELAEKLTKEYEELLEKNPDATDDDKADIIGPYFTIPAVFLNGEFFLSHISNTGLVSFIRKLSTMGQGEIDPTAKLMQDIYGDNESDDEDDEFEELPITEPNEEDEKVDEEDEKVSGEMQIDKSKEEYFQEVTSVPLFHKDIPELKIRYHREKYPDLPDVVQHGNFIDLYVAKGCNLKAGEFKLIDLGISVECPEGYWMQLVPRSSTFKKYGVIQTNSFGVIDTEYCGDNDIVMLPVYATRNTRIPKGERICQFTLVKDVNFNINSVPRLNGKDRGGFGSTGRK